MTGQGLSLKPFPTSGALPDIKITAVVGRLSDTLLVRYELLGPLADLLIPAPADRPSRRDRLWEETCFELFIRPKDADHYWEINLSPAGYWNVYHFGSYRQGMREESAWTTLPFRVTIEQNALRLSLELELNKINLADQDLRIAVSAVIKPSHGSITYWALAHPGPQPDFHHSDSFIAEL